MPPAAELDGPRRQAARKRRPFLVRITHWINAYAMTCVILSGWQIYNASPLFGFAFPRWATLGGWLAGGIAWHFAAMWLLVANGLLYLGYGLFSGYLRRTLLPLRPLEIWRDFTAAATFRLQHEPGVYNAVQRLLYLVVILLAAAAVLSGLAIWKPVQFSPLTAILGGYDIARLLHFLAMAGIVCFILVHLALVLLVPRTLLSMITGHPGLAHAKGTDART